MVGSTSVSVGAHNNHTVLNPGSSITLSRAFAAESVKRSASSITTTRQLAIDGAQDALLINSLTSSIFIDNPSVLISSTSAWEPVIVDIQSLHLLQPPSEQTKAAAKATAALDRPDPGGPVNSHAWVMPCELSL
jgi:adenylate cyclase